MERSAINLHDNTEAGVVALRALILAAEAFRAATAEQNKTGVRETVAVSYLTSRGPLAQRELGAAMGLTPGAVTALVDRLERDGLARRMATGTDRRRTTVALTPDGVARAARAREVMARCFDRVADPAAAATMLLTIAGNLRREAETPSGAVPGSDTSSQRPRARTHRADATADT